MARRPRWPNILEQTVVVVMITLLATAGNRLWEHFTDPYERFLIVLGGILIGAVVVVVYEVLRGERVGITFTDVQYDKELTRLAEKHKGTIKWVAKTSIWADPPDEHEQRLQKKIEGIKCGRIENIKYILHLGYWRKLVQEDLDQGNQGMLKIYLQRLNRLLVIIKNNESCPPDKVQFVVGEIEQSGPSYRFGVYQARSYGNSYLALDYEATGGEDAPPRLILRNQADLLEHLDGLFDKQWNKHVERTVASIRGAAANPIHTVLRDALVNTVRAELQWVNSQVDDESLKFDALVQIHSCQADFNANKKIELTCPQKVTISGDYGDMYEGGLTLTAAVNVRARLTLRRIRGRKSTIEYSAKHGTGRIDAAAWPLIWALQQLLDEERGGYEVEIFPTQQIDVGLGSSGAASLLIAAAVQIIRQGSPSLRELVKQAHEFEKHQAECPCGPQDHAACVLGWLHLIEYPTLKATRVPYTSVWDRFSFWRSNGTRRAREVIPGVIRRHTEVIWRLKREITRTLADAFATADVAAILEAVSREFSIQMDLEMATDRQVRAVGCVQKAGGAAKISGAGGGGTLVVVAPDSDTRAQIGNLLRDHGFREVSLSVDSRGLAVESS
ncbi:MAG: hypothetical protein IH851_06215 [Armatimonadetes bacterium]|nr:hypothetical protein [Armatimonadota bacterium]